MVGFGNSIVKARREGWNDAYLDYQKLKDIVEEIEALLTDRKSVHFGDAFSLKSKSNSEASLVEGKTVEEVKTLKQSFFHELKLEIEKLSLFILQQQGRLADSVGALRFNTSLFDHNSSLFTDAQLVLDPSNRLDQYSVLGVDLLHLQKFVCVNSIGVRKILKKYNKVFEKMDDPHTGSSRYEVSGDHLQQLAYSPSIRAIESSLQSALAESFTNLPAATTHTAALLRVQRFQCVMSCSDRLRRNAEILQQPFWDFLSRKAMILTGSNLGGMEGSGNKALEWLIKLRPEELLTMSEEQLEQLWNRWSGGPIATEVKGHVRLPSHLPKQIMDNTREEELDDLTKEDVAISVDKGWKWGGANSASMILNLLSTLLYTVNYYIVAPTANHYAMKLGADGAFGSTLIGASSFSAIFAAFFYSLWYTKSSFKSALIFSAMCPVIGNLIYALAISFNSLTMAICGRILCGFGSAEVVNRQLISACVNFEGMTKASALFVAAGAIGMSVGPLLAAILDIVAGRDSNVDIRMPFFPAGGIICDHVTSPGFLMSGLWLLELMALVFLFEEPNRINGRTEGFANSGDEGSLVNSQGYGSIPSGDGMPDEKTETSLWKEAVVTTKLIFQNPALPVTVVIFGYIEMADEVLISSCSMVVRRYFGWHGSVAGFLIASLGALVLPAHFVVEKASHYYSERNIMSKSLVFILISLLGITNWSGLIYDVGGSIATEDNDTGDYSHVLIGDQELDSLLTDKGEFLYDFGSGPVVYVVFLSAAFMGTIVLEGVDTSILAKSTPAALNDRFVNSGLLATLVGTLGRVVADASITCSALLDIHVLIDFVNATFLPVLVLTVAGLYLVRRFYKQLV